MPHAFNPELSSPKGGPVGPSSLSHPESRDSITAVPSDNLATTSLTESVDLQRVRRSWKCASCIHFLRTFAPELGRARSRSRWSVQLCPEVIERAIADPVTYGLVGFYTGALQELLAALGLIRSEDSRKRREREGDGAVEPKKWFSRLRELVQSRVGEFGGTASVPGLAGGSNYDGEEGWVRAVGWTERLEVLYGLCCISAGEAEVVRKLVRDCESERGKLEGRRIRLKPIGRCSRRRFYWSVGAGRIYSGYRRTGAGTLAVECSNAEEMRGLVARLVEGPDVSMRDTALGARIRDLYLRPLVEEGLRQQRRLERELALALAKEESRRRNLVRPRRSKAAYSLAS